MRDEHTVDPEPEIPIEQKEEIFVALPTVTATVNVAILRFMLLLQQASVSATSPWKFSYYVVNGKRPVEYARNLLVGAFIEQTSASRLWFMDEDMMPGVDTHALLQVDGDIVAARAFAFDHSHEDKPPALKLCVFHYNLNNDFRFNCVQPKVGDPLLMDVAAVGTATMLIKRNVLTDRRLWLDGAFRYFDDHRYDCSDRATDSDAGDGFAPPIFRALYKPNGKILRGEDLDFCQRAGALGYSIKADLGIKVGHHKAVNIDEVAELCQLVAERVESKAVRKLQLVEA